MTWQRARVVRVASPDAVLRVGDLVWVQGPPMPALGECVDETRRGLCDASAPCRMLDLYGWGFGIHANAVELLPEFREPTP